jgi:phospholipase C
MIRLKLGLLLLSLIGLAVIPFGCGGGSSSTTTTTQGDSKINHIVIIFQENRTPDNLFQDPVLISRGADIATQGTTSTGAIVKLTPVSLVTNYDLGHGHDSFLEACDYNASTNTCAMDGADTNQCDPSQNCPADPEYQYVQASDVQPYYTMAETYTFGDRMFQTNQGPSFPAHQYILSGTSRIAATSTIEVSENPSKDGRDTTPVTYWAGCLAPPGSEDSAIDISNPNPEAQQTTVYFPLCYEHPTLTDLLDNANLSWKYYAPSAGYIWTAPDAIQHMCVPYSQDGNFDDTVCSGSDWTATSPKVVIEGTNPRIINDISAGQLANVSWVIPDGQSSDHADSNNGTGPSWVAAIVNAIGQSNYWSDTAIIVTWDDWGGWYDHVPPPQIRDSYEFGFRVPLIVISPYAKAAYVSHQPNDFGSILKFIEENFSLPEIYPPVGYADSYALGDLSDCFNFSQTPLAFSPIAAQQDAKHFLEDKSKPLPPDDD